MRKRMKDTDRLSRLDEQRLVIFEILQRAHDRVECFPASRCSAGTAVNDQLPWILCNVFVEVVHQHPHCGFLMPAFTGNDAASRCANWCVFRHISYSAS